MKPKDIGTVVLTLLFITSIYMNSMVINGYELGIKVGDNFVFELKKAQFNTRVTEAGFPVEVKTKGLSIITSYEPWETVTIDEGDKFSLHIDEISTGSNNSALEVETSIVYYNIEALPTPYTNFSLDLYSWDASNDSDISMLFIILFGGFTGLSLPEIMDSTIMYADDAWWSYLETKFDSLSQNITGKESEDDEFSLETTYEEFGIYLQTERDFTLYSEAYPIDVTLKSRIVWEKATGILYGFVVDLNWKMEFEEGSSSTDINYEITREGYKIKGLQNGGLISGFEFVCVFLILSLFISINRHRT